MLCKLFFFKCNVVFCYLFDAFVHYRSSSAYNAPFWTTNSGAPVYNNNNSLTVGSRGPILLEDYHLVEKLANFDRERIPERVVHARGASAKGFFEVTHDITALTCADFLRAPGVQTPVIVRFSTVIHERGSPETLRDPRGFAVKFYTRECVIEKENNFKQPGDRFRSFSPDRQERFINRIVGGLSDPRVTHEVRSIWVSYWSQKKIKIKQNK
ncbi:putative catalase [Helianthus debilis subsp. tardiflorus]